MYICTSQSLFSHSYVVNEWLNWHCDGRIDIGIRADELGIEQMNWALAGSIFWNIAKKRSSGGSHNVCKTVWLLCMATWPGCYDWVFGRLEKMSKISFFVVTHAQSCWTVVFSTKSVSAELSDFGLWRQLKVESEIKSPWTLKTKLNDIINILYKTKYFKTYIYIHCGGSTVSSADDGHYNLTSTSWHSSSGLRGRRRTYRTMGRPCPF
jgi:hypothetical protein